MIPETRLWPTIVAALREVAAWPFRVAAARATLKALANMDRRELADIGLNSSDVRDASALPLGSDPTAVLATRARERRRGAFGPPPAIQVVGPLRNDPDDLLGPGQPASRPGPKPTGQNGRLVRTG